jgi:hypothetical protein
LVSFISTRSWWDATAQVVARPEAFSTGAPWLSRALTVSLALHLVAALVGWVAVRKSDTPKTTTVDIEIAPPPPMVEALPEEVAKPPESAPAATQDNAATTPEAPAHDENIALHDAGVDAPVDAPTDAPLDAGRKKPRPDAAPDAGVPMVAEVDILDAGVGGDAEVTMGSAGGEVAALSDAGVPASDDAGERIAAIESGSGAGSGAGVGSGEGSGVPAAVETGSGSGAPGVDNQPAVAGAPTTAGTAANLLAYFPAGHQITALIRFDRLRNTEWADPAEQLFKPMPDYQGLFGSKNVTIGSKFDTLVISSPSPRDATATTLVVHAPIPRPELRDFLANPDTPITWTLTKGGMFGRRTGKVFKNDKRVLLAPWRDWIVLAQPTDLSPRLLAPAKGSIDTFETKATLPPWLQTIRTIEKESGEGPRGPALVLTLAGPGQRYEIPDVGLGVTSLPSPQRISCAMELVQQGWLIRGNIVFAKEADAKELVTVLEEAQQRIKDSRIFSALLRRQHMLNVVTGLSLARTGARVSYATSMSIADARAIFAAAAQTLGAYFTGQPQP